MVNACMPQGEPILGAGGEKKTGLCTLVLYAFYFTSGGISLPPAMAPNVCIDKNLDLIL